MDQPTTDRNNEMRKLQQELEMYKKAGTYEESEDTHVMNIENSKKEYEDMGELGEWIHKKPVKSSRIKYGSRIPKTFEFTAGNYAMLYRGDTFIRFVPFIARNDLLTDQSWAEFRINSYYNKPASWWPWNWASHKILWTGLDKSGDYADTIGGGGLLIKIDEHSKTQLPLRMKINDTERQTILKNNRINGKMLLLKTKLQNYEKPKTNWWFWGIIIIVVIFVAALVLVYAINPHIFSQIGSSLGGSPRASPPPAPQGASKG